MILKRQFNPIKVLSYVWRELLYTLIIALSLAGLSQTSFSPSIHSLGGIFPPALLTLFGTALAIFLAFRTNTAYSRWWEARSLWATLTASSRIFARQIQAACANALAIGKGGGADSIEQFQREVLYRHVAIAHCLRLTLRSSSAFQSILPLLPEEEQAHFIKAVNKLLYLINRQGLRVKEGMRLEILGPFDNITLEPQLSSLNTSIAMLERIKQTPLLRQYDYFTRLLLWLFISIVPFSLFGLLNGSFWFLMLAVLVAFIFSVVQRVGEVTESPFEGKIQDVPMTAICTELERDFREMLGESPLPSLPLPQNGYLD